jgi:hypothetical protein
MISATRSPPEARAELLLNVRLLIAQRHVGWFLRVEATPDRRVKLMRVDRWIA